MQLRTGPHVFHGGFSTFLSVVVFMNEYLGFIRTFFKVLPSTECFMLSLINKSLENMMICSQVMVLLVSLGLFHALVALPALLSFLGPSTIHS